MMLMMPMMMMMRTIVVFSEDQLDEWSDILLDDELLK